MFRRVVGLRDFPEGFTYIPRPLDQFIYTTTHTREIGYLADSGFETGLKEIPILSNRNPNKYIENWMEAAKPLYFQ